MRMEDTFESLFNTSSDDMTSEKLIEMFFNPKGVNMKTEIPSSALMALCVLESYTIRMKELKLTKSYKLTTNIIKLYKELMVSRDRKGREEGEKMIGAIRETIKTNSIFGKLLGRGNGNKV